MIRSTNSVLVLVLVYSWSFAVSGVAGETVETTWRLANFLCETSNYILMPGRSYKKAGLIRTLSIGQTIWMKGWRMVTEREPDKAGNIRYLKVDFIPEYNVLIRKYLCEYDQKQPNTSRARMDSDGTYRVPTDSPNGQKNADDRCKVGNGELAKIGRNNVTNALDIIGKKIPHWARLVTSDESIAKQCLVGKRTSTSIKYSYEDCSKNHPFICLEDEEASKVFAPIVSKRTTAFKTFAKEIEQLKNRVTTPAPTTPDMEYSRLSSSLTTIKSVQSNYSQSVKESIISTDVVVSPSSHKFTTFSSKDFNTDLASNSSSYLSLTETSSYWATESATIGTSIISTSRSSSNDLIPSITDISNVKSVDISSIHMVNTIPSVHSTFSVSDPYETTQSAVLKSLLSTSLPVIYPVSSSAYDSVHERKYDTSIHMHDSIVHSAIITDTVTYSDRVSEKSLPLKSFTDSFTVVHPSLASDYSISINNSQTALPSTLEKNNKLHSIYNTSVDNESGSYSKQQIYSSFVLDSISNRTDHTLLSKIETTIPLLNTTIESSLSEESQSSFGGSSYTSTVLIYSDSSLGYGTSQVFTTTKETTAYTTLVGSFATATNTLQPSFSIEASENSTVSQYKTPIGTDIINSWKYAISNTTIHPHNSLFNGYDNITDYQNMTTHSSKDASTISDQFTTEFSLVTEWSSDIHSSFGMDDKYSDAFKQTSHEYTQVLTSSTIKTIDTISATEVHIASAHTGLTNSSQTTTVPKVNIKPTPTKDVYMSHDFGRTDYEERNMPSKEPSQKDMSLLMWIAIGVIAVACLISVVVAVILYKRKKMQRKAVVISNGNHHPMNGQKSELSPNEMDALLSKKPSRTKAQESDVFVNEAYDL